MFTEPRCPSGKTRYATWRHAAYDARALRRHKSNRSNREQPYSCSRCSGFHVGNSSNPKRKMKEL